MTGYTIIMTLLILLAGGFFFAVKPGKKRDVRKFTGKLYAHRGYFDNKGGIPENSIAAFRRAKAHKYGVELDVQLTKDDVPVVFHDDTLARMTGGEGHVYDYTYQELQRFSLLRTDEKIPTFADVLKELGTMPIICEIKVPDGQDADHLCEVAAPLIDSYKGDICIESFNPKAVLWFKKNRPGMIRGQLSMNFMAEKGLPFTTRFAMSHLFVNTLGRPDFVAYDVSGKYPLGFKACVLAWKPMLVAWTVTSQEEQDKLKGFDAVIFEQYPAK